MGDKMENLIDALKNSAKTGNGINFIQGEKDFFLGYDALYDKALTYLYYLQERGVKPKDELVFQIENEKDFIVGFWACILGNIIPVPVSLGLKGEHELKLKKIWKILNNPYLLTEKSIYKKSFLQEKEYENKILFSEEAMACRKEGTICYPDKGDIAFIQFSSGSTGNPKGVVLSHENLLTNINGILKGAQISKKDTALSWVPLTHDLGLIGFHLSPLVGEINQHIMPTIKYIMHPLLWLEKANEYRVSLLSSPNFGYKHFMNFFSKEKIKDWDLSCVRLIFNGAEPICADLSNKFYDVLSSYKLKKNAVFPVYGLAEASLGVTFPPVEEELKSITLDRESIGINCKIKAVKEEKNKVKIVDLGHPIEGCQLRICNKDNEIVEEEVVGHIQIKGKNVTKRYYNNEKATKEILTEDGWLNTGDLGFLKKKRLFITGRAKDIIFINGQNFYPHDIERVAEKVEKIELGKIAVCGIFNENTQREEITPFVIHKGGIESFIPIMESLKKHINQETGLEVGNVIPIRRMPKTTSGKVQRYKLKQAYEKGEYESICNEIREWIKNNQKEKKIQKEKNTLEKKLLEIWCEVLGREDIAIEEDFFSLGGNSLKATYIAARIQKELKVEIPLKDFFENTTIKLLGAYIAKKEHKNYVPIEKVKEQEKYLASHEQNMLYVLSQLNNESTHYNITKAITIRGKLDKAFLQEACKKIVNRHESLRTYFEWKEENLYQKIKADNDFEINYIKTSKERVKKEISNFVKPFDVYKPFLFRMMLLEIKETEHIFLLDIHHSIGDGSSIGIILKEIIDCYEGKENNPIRVQYKDYAAFQKSLFWKEKMDKEKEYWLGELKEETPILNLLEDFQRPPVQSFEGDTLSFHLDTENTKKLKEIAKKQNVSLYMLLMAAYFIFLSKYTGQEDIIIGTPVGGRNHPDIENTVGMFVNTLGIRAYPKGIKDFTDFLKEVKESIFNAMAHPNYPFEKLVQHLSLQRDSSRNPLFDTMFVLQNMDFSQIKGKTIKIQSYDYKDKTAKFDLTIFAEEKENGISFELEYCIKIYKEETIKSFGKHYIHILKETLQNPKRKIKDLSVLSTKEKEEMLYEYNHTKAVYPKEKTVNEIFEEQVEKTPNHIALIEDEKEMTYEEVNKKSNQIARFLRRKGIEKGDLVGVMMERSCDFILSIMGILKAGGGYIPIDPSYPKDRVEYMLQDSKAKILLVDKNTVEEIGYEGNILYIRDESIFLEEDKNIKSIHHSKDVAYVIYTSGSTGKPKGVMLEHESVINYVWWAAKSYVKGETLNFPLYTSISFDLTVTSIYVPLITGNTMVIYKEEDPSLLVEKVFEENKVGIVKLTPAHLKIIKEKDNKNVKIKRLIVGGEQLETKLAKKVYESFGEDIEIYNEYGPTETAVGCMIYQYDPLKDKQGAVPIGIPGDNVQIYLLDAHQNPVPKNAMGEIYISGDGVAREYLGKENLTREKFLDNPYILGKRMYKTGDIGRRLLDGNIEFIGRLDDQVKIKGYRIEINEIEKILLQHENIKEALVIARTDEETNKYLCGYIVAKKELKQEELRSFLIEKLPTYMIPSYFVSLESMPLTQNGKVDKKNLPEPIKNRMKEASYVEGVDEIEKKMAAIWENVLKIEKVGREDNYFSLGGDSIKAIQMVSKLNQEGMDLKVKDILTYQTISKIRNHVHLSCNEKIYSQGYLRGSAPFLPIHHWFFNKNFKNIHHYNQSLVLELKKDISVENINRAFKILINHHDGLRLNYDSKENQLWFNPTFIDMNFYTPIYTIGALQEEKEEEEIRKIGEDIKSRLNLFNELLLKTAMIHREKKSSLLLITMHHILVDGVSWRIIIEDLFYILEEMEKNQEVKMMSKTASIQDWYEGLKEYAQKVIAEKEYWKSIEDYDFQLPQDIQTKDWTMKNMDTVQVELDKRYTEKLRYEANEAYNTTIEDLLVGAVGKAIKTWTKKSTIKMEMESHGRFLEDINVSRSIGWFTTMYPIKLCIEEEGLKGEIIEIKEQLRAVPHAGEGYALLKYIQKDLKEKEEKASIRFNYLGIFEEENERYDYYRKDSGREVGLENNMTAKIEINCMILQHILTLNISYNRSAYKKETIEQVGENIIEYLKLFIDHTTKEEEIHLTPSDFDTVELSQSDLDSIFA